MSSVALKMLFILAVLLYLGAALISQMFVGSLVKLMMAGELAPCDGIWLVTFNLSIYLTGFLAVLAIFKKVSPILFLLVAGTAICIHFSLVLFCSKFSPIGFDGDERILWFAAICGVFFALQKGWIHAIHREIRDDSVR